MVVLLSTVLTAALLLEPVSSSDESDNLLGFATRTLAARLPTPLSDHTACVIADKAYLAGGCDAPAGNVYNEDVGEFICGSISRKLYAFDHVTETFDATTTLPDLPTPRYRHAAACVNNQIWLLGGREQVNDTIITDVDVFDVDSNNWTTFTDLPEKYWISDHTGFAYNNSAFFAGGYNDTYTALQTVFAIDVVASFASQGEQLVIVEKDPLLFTRGDVSSAVDDEGSYVIVSGGFTHQNNFCEPLEKAEMYLFDGSDQWKQIASMQAPRSDKVLVELDDRVFAIGGERQITNICEFGDPPEVGEKTIAVDAVEVYDVAKNTWTRLEDLPNHRFRFAAVGFDAKANGTIYAFGGQTSYNKDCQCYTTSDEVNAYTKAFSNAPLPIGMGVSAIMGMAVTLVVALF